MLWQDNRLQVAVSRPVSMSDALAIIYNSSLPDSTSLPTSLTPELLRYKLVSDVACRGIWQAPWLRLPHVSECLGTESGKHSHRMLLTSLYTIGWRPEESHPVCDAMTSCPEE